MGEGRDIAYHFIVKSTLHVNYIFIVIWPIFVVVLLSEADFLPNGLEIVSDAIVY